MSKENNPIRPLSEAEIVGSLYLEGLTESRYDNKQLARIKHDDEGTEIEICLLEGYQDGTALFRWVAKYLSYIERIELYIRNNYTSIMDIRLKPGLVTRYITSAEQEELAKKEATQEAAPETTPEATPDNAGTEGIGALEKGESEATPEA